MENNFENYVINLPENKKALSTSEHLTAGAIINVKRIIMELQELENDVLNKTPNAIFSILILGSQLENIKREIIKIKLDFRKKW